MRQYEKEDCVEVAKRNQKLGIGTATISISPGCEVDYVAVFGNPETNKIVFVPFGSKMKIENEEYKIIKGEKYAGKRYAPTRKYNPGVGPEYGKITGEIWNYSAECLLDKDKKLHSLEDFMGKEVIFLGRNFFRFCR